MEIRDATESDIPQVLPLVAAMCALHAQWDPDRFQTRDHPEQMYERWLTERTRDRHRSIFLVAEHEQAIVGYIVATIESEIRIYALGEFGWVHDLWVEETYRNEGIGRQMAMLTIERFAQLGVRQIRLQTAAGNDAARRLWGACGFRVSTIDMLMTLPAQEAEQ